MLVNRTQTRAKKMSVRGVFSGLFCVFFYYMTLLATYILRPTTYNLHSRSNRRVLLSDVQEHVQLGVVAVAGDVVALVVLDVRGGLTTLAEVLAGLDTLGLRHGADVLDESSSSS